MNIPAPTVVKPGTQTPAETGTATCVIGCKLPHGIVIEVGMDRVPMGDGPRAPVQLIRGPKYRAFVCKGRNADKVVGGYGITTGVPTAQAAQWFKDNAALRYVRDGSVIMVADLAQLRGEAKDRLGARTGFEPIHPIDPSDPRNKGINQGDPRAVAEARAAYFAQANSNPARNSQVDELGDAATGTGAIAPASAVAVPAGTRG